MASLSIWHWLVVLIVIGLIGFPVLRILQKAGYSGWMVILWFIPLVNLVALWVFALARWPLERKALAIDL